MTLRQSPYVGLLPFSSEDAAYFFGRETETRNLHDSVMSARCTLVYGPSGVGKSSIINAGLLPILRKRDDVIAVPFREWSGIPVPAIAHAVNAAVVASLKRHEIHDGESLAESLNRAANNLAESLDDQDELVQRPGRVVVIFDQFDEYIINYRLAPETERELAAAFARPHPNVAVLISIREDWLARLDRYGSIFPSLLDNFLRIEPLSSKGALEAIHRPIVHFAALHPDAGPTSADGDLANAVVEQVRRGELLDGRLQYGALDTEDAVDTAFLQVVLQRLWDEERQAASKALRLDTLRRLGNASSILNDHLARVFDTLDAVQQDRAVEMFDRLVTPSETKIAQSADDLAVYLGTDIATLEPILQRLAAPDARILRAFAPRDRPDSKRYELYHDLLAKPVRSWLVGRRVEAQVDAYFVNRPAAEAEAARRILETLISGPASTEGLSRQIRLPAATITKSCRSLQEVGILFGATSGDEGWTFRPGRGYRRELFDAPYDELLESAESFRLTVIVAALAVLAAAGSLAAILSHPISWLGHGVAGQLFDATLVLGCAALAGALTYTLYDWWRRAKSGLATASQRSHLSARIGGAAAGGTGAVGFFYYGIAYLSGNGSWLLGRSTLWLAILAAAGGALYAQEEFIGRSRRPSSRRITSGGEGSASGKAVIHETSASQGRKLAP